MPCTMHPAVAAAPLRKPAATHACSTLCHSRTHAPTMSWPSETSLPCPLQAMELDEAQRDASDVFGLRQQLASAQQAETHLRQQLAQLRQQQAASAGGGAGASAGGGDDLSPRGSVRSGDSSCSSPARQSCSVKPALSGRLDVAARELAAARQEVRLGTAWAAHGCHRCAGMSTLPSAVCCMPCLQSLLFFPLCLTAHASMMMGFFQPAAPFQRPLLVPWVPPPQVDRLRDDRDRLRDELDARDNEVMQLQGQLVMLRNQAADDANWLSPLPDPYA